jgi:hypothetical protein
MTEARVHIAADFGLHSTPVGHGLQVAGAMHEAGAGNIPAASQSSGTPCPKPSHAGMPAPADIGTITGEGS